jgi:hypothetical protein
MRFNIFSKEDVRAFGVCKKAYQNMELIMIDNNRVIR